MKVKDFFFKHYINQTFQKIVNENDFTLKKVEDFLYSIPKELVSRFAYLEVSSERSPLLFATIQINVDLIRLLVESLSEDKTEAYIMDTGARDEAKMQLLIASNICFYTLLPYMKS